jgi:hypothetical protein
MPWSQRQCWVVGGCTLGYYSCSVTVILFNKWAMSSQGFSFPYFVTLCYLVVKGVECGLLQKILQLPGRTFDSWSEYILQVVMVGVAVAVQICLQNISFLYVSVALYTMIGASVPVWQLCWGMSPCFRLEQFSLSLTMAIILVASGLAVISVGAASASPTGVILLLGSVCLSGCAPPLPPQLHLARPVLTDLL